MTVNLVQRSIETDRFTEQAEVSARLKRLEHQTATVLYLSGVNLIANAVTVIVAVLALAL